MNFLSKAKLIYVFLLFTTFLSLSNAFYLIRSGTSHQYLLENQAGYALASIFTLILFRKRILCLLLRIEKWAILPNKKYARQATILLFLVLTGTYQSKAFLGFWFPGISGWTEVDLLTQTRRHPPTDLILEKPSHFVSQAIISEHARYLSVNGYLEGPAVFLHFSDASVRPANDELLGFVFPGYALNSSTYNDLQLNQACLRIIRHSLSERRSAKRFLLPETIAYPAHTPYMSISYCNYPDHEELIGVSWWRITVKIIGEKPPEVIGAQKIHSIGETG